MDQTDDVALFVNSDQPSAYRKYAIDLREVLFVKLGLADLDSKRVSAPAGRAHLATV